MYIEHHIKYRYSTKILMKHDSFPQTFEKGSNLINIYPMETQLLYAETDRHTDRLD